MVKTIMDLTGKTVRMANNEDFIRRLFLDKFEDSLKQDPDHVFAIRSQYLFFFQQRKKKRSDPSASASPNEDLFRKKAIYGLVRVRRRFRHTKNVFNQKGIRRLLRLDIKKKDGTKREKDRVAEYEA